MPHLGYRQDGPASGHPADAWSVETVRRMLAQNYTADAILRHLEAYGLSFYAAQALLREMDGVPLPR